MAITPQQKTAITAKLSVSLSSLTDDKLIELCLLYRSAPEALPTFPDLLATEITRRFTAAEIAVNDVMFSVIQNFSNQFNPELQYKEKMYEFVNSLDRDVWVSQNVSFFDNVINTDNRMQWIVANSDIVRAIVGSGAAMTIIATSSTAMRYIAGSVAAMSMVSASSTALSAIVKSSLAKTALMTNNDVFQQYGQQIFDTVSASWSKQFSGKDGKESNAYSQLSIINNGIVNPSGFSFFVLGTNNITSSAIYGSILTHPNEIKAAESIPKTNINPTSISGLNAVSFNGAKVSVNGYGHGAAYAELWIPPA